MGFTSYSVKNDREFKSTVRKALAQVGDLRVPFQSIQRDFYKSEKAIFSLKGPGQYPDLAPSTKNEKFRDFGFRYPILKRTGRLERSVTSANSPDSISFVGKKTLIIGTSVPYGIFHQSDEPRKKIPLRKFLFIGPEAKKFATSQQVGRARRWTRIIDEYVSKQLEQLGRVNV